MTDVDVSIERVSKQYRLGTGRGADVFWALRDIDFRVPQGASYGIIGRNGAGKSTLLKLLAAITAPTRGRIVIAGRLAALIEVGSGFHPELTGRENVFLSGAILGMRRREISEKLARIVEFAGVERFIDTPVKWYSSGMYVRLGFSIAAHLEPDILLVDEVLAVGDAEFQTRCLQRIGDLKRQGITIIFISHDLTAVEHLCDTAVLLEKGCVAEIGAPAEVVASYHRSFTAEAARAGDVSDLAHVGAVTVSGLSFHAPYDATAVSYRTGHPLTVALRFDASKTVGPLIFEVSYYTADGKTLLAAASTGGAGGGVLVKAPGGVVHFTCPSLPLHAGSYYVGAVVRDAASGHVLHWWDGGTMLHVEQDGPGTGQFYVPHSWRLTHTEHGVSDAGVSR